MELGNRAKFTETKRLTTRELAGGIRKTCGETKFFFFYAGGYGTLGQLPREGNGIIRTGRHKNKRSRPSALAIALFRGRTMHTANKTGFNERLDSSAHR